MVGLGIDERIDIVKWFYTYDFDTRANLKIRAIFGNSNALGFMFRIPFVNSYEIIRYKEDAIFSVRYTA